MISQVQKSSVVLLNKIDTVSPDGVSQVRARISEINPDAYIVETRYAKVSREVLDRYLHGEENVVEDSLNTTANRPFGGTLYMPSYAGDLDVEGFLRAVSPKMLRIKGFFYKGKQLYHADCVSGDIRIDPTDIEAEELANEITLIADSGQDLTQYLTENMKRFFGEDLSQVIFLPN